MYYFCNALLPTLVTRFEAGAFVGLSILICKFMGEEYLNKSRNVIY